MLETERLVIRRFTDSDVADIFRMRSDEEIMRFIGDTHDSPEASADWMKLISRPLDSEGVGYRALEERDSGAVVGWCGLWRLTETGETEVGYAITRSRWGKGYATEAAFAVVDNAFRDLGFEEIVAVAYPENSASIRVMEKLGMSFVRIGTFYGKRLAQYSVSASHWTEINGHR